MPTEPIDPVESANAAELAKLRQLTSELLAKHARDKAQLTDLQTGTATLQAKLTETSDSLYQATVGVPLRMMAEAVSTVPDLFLEQFSKHFQVASVKGVLTLQTPDGKAVFDKDGKAIPFERDVLTKLLIEGDDARAKTFKAITIASRASGSASAGFQRTTPAPAKAQFGLGVKVQ